MKKIISLFTALCIVFGVLGTFTVFADDTAADLEISTLAELEEFRDDVNSGNTYEGKTVKLTADIDMSEKYGEGKESWTPIRTFAGIFDGNGHKICNLYYYDGTEEFDTENPVGFFIYNNGTIKNLGIEGSITHMRYSMVGGIAAMSDGIIENCYFSGMITSPAHVGGIVGSGNIKNCYNTATIKGFHCVGGLAGTDSNIMNCYNAGNIIKMTAEDTSLFWESEYLGSITEWLAYEENVLNCYYLEGTYDIGAYTEEGTIDTTTALTAEQFANQSSFENWDFDTVWEMDEALGRPILQSNREAPPVLKYNIEYKDGSAIVTVPQGGAYTIIFASYKEGRLLSVNAQDKQLKKGRNEPIAPQNFNAEGNIKIMLWDSLEGMKPFAVTELLSDTFIQ